jgi:chromosome segregation ATPase
MAEKPEEAANIANEIAGFYQATGDAAEGLREHQGERNDLQAKIDLQQKNIREELAERDKLKQILVQKGIAIPSGNDALAQHASGKDVNADPQLHAYILNENVLMQRQSILQNLMIELAATDHESISKKGPVQIKAAAEIPKSTSRPNLVHGVLLFAVEGAIFGAMVATMLEVFRFLIASRTRATQTRLS